jgi:hypothetical protein
MEYKIVSHAERRDTEDEVNAFLKEGWALHGGLKVADSAYTQAMIKHGDYEGGNAVDVYMPNQEAIEDAIKSIGDALETGLANVAQALAHKD